MTVNHGVLGSSPCSGAKCARVARVAACQLKVGVDNPAGVGRKPMKVGGEYSD